MKLATFKIGNSQYVGALVDNSLVPFRAEHGNDVDTLIKSGVTPHTLAEMLETGLAPVDPTTVTYLPPVVTPPKIICVGLNYADHTKESPYDQPAYPTLFPRFTSSITGHDSPIIRPLCSDSLDYEGELAVVLKGGGRHLSKKQALEYVFGYSMFNDGSVREYQFKSPQWTVGKNFDNTGAFGPHVITSDEVPLGAKGLQLETRLNGKVVQSANTDEMIYDVATLISIISEAITLQAGDVIVAGTPSGIGWAREPRLLMREADVVEVSISKIGVLRNTIRDEVSVVAL